MEEKKINWLNIVSLSITVLLAMFKSDTNALVIYPIIGVILVIVIINIILTKTKSNKNLSNTAVVVKTKKYTQYLWNLVKANKKQMQKEVNISDLKRLQKKNKRVLDYFENKSLGKKQEYVNLDKEKQTLISNFVKKNNKYVTSEMIKVNKPYDKVVKESNQSQTIQVYNVLYETIHDLERILLQLEQHSLRIKLGKYVVKCSNNIDETVHAYVDLIGWTHILLGDNKKGFASIQSGIDLINYKLNSLEKNTPEYFKYVLLKARALRHIGTTYYTYRSKKDKFVKEKLLEAIALISDKDVVDYYNSTPSLKEKYGKMMFGLKYNVLLYDYYVALENKDEIGEKINIISKGVEELRKEVDSSDFDDNHRMVKVLTLQNQIEKNKILQSKTLDDDRSKEWTNQLHKDLHSIEAVLNKNIYFDEAMEVYICQKVDELYSNVERIFVNKTRD